MVLWVSADVCSLYVLPALMLNCIGVNIAARLRIYRWLHFGVLFACDGFEVFFDTVSATFFYFIKFCMCFVCAAK